VQWQLLLVEKDDQVIRYNNNKNLGFQREKHPGRIFVQNISKYCSLKILISFRGKIVVLFCWLGLVFSTPVFTILVQFLSFTKKTGNGITHDYYSIWFNSTAVFFISQNKLRVSKIKNHYCLVSLMWMKIGSNDITAQVPGVS
jgi:hypothetical protein